MQTAVMGREKTFNVRFSDEEWARLEALSQHHGLNAAALIRFLLKKEENELAVTAPSAGAEAERERHRKGVRAVIDLSRSIKEDEKKRKAKR